MDFTEKIIWSKKSKYLKQRRQYTHEAAECQQYKSHWTVFMKIPGFSKFASTQCLLPPNF